MALFGKKADEGKRGGSFKNTSYSSPYIDELVEHYKERLLKDANLEYLTSLSQGEMRLSIEKIISQFMTEEKVVIPRHDKEVLLTRLIDESVGFGPLEALLSDPDITEILINGPKEVFIEKDGHLQTVDIEFRDENHIRHIVDRVVAPLGRRIDESSPMVDARLPDGSRVNAVIPPISLNGTLVSIRKFRKEPFTMEDLIGFETLEDDMAEFIKSLVKAKTNILISGGTGSGKTTMLNAFAKDISQNERVITIEDSAELKLDRANVIGMEARPPNVEGAGEINIRQLVKNALRMRPDRIIVGEVRGSEAFDMLQAMNTGHEGSITTVHANSPRDALNRVEGMVVMAGMDLPTNIIREYIVGALDFIIQIERLTDGKRKMMSISEISEENHQIEVREIFKFERTGIDENGEVLGYFRPTGLVPKCLERLKVFGMEVDESIFGGKEGVGHDSVYTL